MIWSIAPVSAPLKARNGEPGWALIATGAPVIAACFAGSVYIAKRLSAGAGRTTDWEMMLRMGHSPRIQNPETPVSARRPDRIYLFRPAGEIDLSGQEAWLPPATVKLVHWRDRRRHRKARNADRSRSTSFGERFPACRRAFDMDKSLASNSRAASATSNIRRRLLAISAVFEIRRNDRICYRGKCQIADERGIP